MYQFADAYPYVLINRMCFSSTDDRDAQIIGGETVDIMNVPYQVWGELLSSNPASHILKPKFTSLLFLKNIF